KKEKVDYTQKIFNTIQQNAEDDLSNKRSIVNQPKDGKTVDLSIEYLSDFTIEDDKEKVLVDSFINYLWDDITELNNPLSLRNNLEINDLQQKNLGELFNYLEYFNKVFANKNAHDNTCMKEMKTKAINLGLFYINQRNVIIGDVIFRKVIKKKMDWYK
ncbi:247_t:CDS:1, partial [Gigaspora margarita]